MRIHVEKMGGRIDVGWNGAWPEYIVAGVPETGRQPGAVAGGGG